MGVWTGGFERQGAVGAVQRFGVAAERREGHGEVDVRRRDARGKARRRADQRRAALGVAGLHGRDAQHVQRIEVAGVPPQDSLVGGAGVCQPTGAMRGHAVVEERLQRRHQAVS